MHVGFQFLMDATGLYFNWEICNCLPQLCVPCRKKHKKKVNDGESWLRQEELEKNLRSPETRLLNMRQLRSIELIGICFIENYYSDYKIRELLSPMIFSSILLIKSFSNYKEFLVDRLNSNSFQDPWGAKEGNGG